MSAKQHHITMLAPYAQNYVAANTRICTRTCTRTCAHAQGRNTFDGSYTCFGYTTENAAAIQRFKAGDVIEKATIVSGAGNLKPKA